MTFREILLLVNIGLLLANMIWLICSHINLSNRLNYVKKHQNEIKKILAEYKEVE